MPVLKRAQPARLYDWQVQAKWVIIYTELEEKRTWLKPVVREVLVTLVIALVIFFLIQTTIQSSIVLYSSMEPNIHEDQRIIISKIVYWFHEPERGDIIVFPNPNNPDEDYIKRIIGLPGEVVEIKDGVVYIHQADGDNLVLDESEYISDPADNDFLGVIIPEENYFVMGDNRNNSYDSRRGWTVPRDEIVGKAWLSIWPLSDWGLVANYSLP
ncbi:MAG: signal peptidase I [Dehalococcoidales bacterium]|nr:signal peptidase I [Dehalococcoidales bacterium]